VPAIIAAAGEQAHWRFLEFFTANIRNKNTRIAYLRAILPFLTWCEGQGVLDLRDIKLIVVAAYIEQHSAAPPTVKQHLAAIRMLFDWLVPANHKAEAYMDAYWRRLVSRKSRRGRSFAPSIGSGS
jgi:integrase/recombinase XerD